jgi:ribosomal protein S24E
MKKKKKFAPILLFTYKRYSILNKTINSLIKNYGSENHELYIFSDGPRNNQEIKKIIKVRQLLKKITGFKKKKIYLRKKNLGLAKNITTGISKIIKSSKKVIVIEDDLILNKNFLNYMNECLNKFESEKKIWHVNGWNYDLSVSNKNKNTFFWRGMSCWGWGTWVDRWIYYKRNSNYLVENWSKNKIRKFNYDGTYDFWSQVKRNHEKKIKTWAIFWYTTIFENKGLCVSPFNSLTHNIGDDDLSTHTPNLRNSLDRIPKKFSFKKKIKFSFFNQIQENDEIFKNIKMKLFLNLSLKKKFKFFLDTFL